MVCCRCSKNCTDSNLQGTCSDIQSLNTDTSSQGKNQPEIAIYCIQMIKIRLQHQQCCPLPVNPNMRWPQQSQASDWLLNEQDAAQGGPVPPGPSRPTAIYGHLHRVHTWRGEHVAPPGRQTKGNNWWSETVVLEMQMFCPHSR